MFRKKNDNKQQYNISLYRVMEEEVNKILSKKNKTLTIFDDEISIMLKNKITTETINYIKESEQYDLEKREKGIKQYMTLFEKIYKYFPIYNAAFYGYLNRISDYKDIDTFLIIYGVNVPASQKGLMIKIIWAGVRCALYHDLIDRYQGLFTEIFNIRNNLKQIELPVYSQTYQNVTEISTFNKLKDLSHDLGKVIETELNYLNNTEAKITNISVSLKKQLDKQNDVYDKEIPEISALLDNYHVLKSDVESVKTRIELYYRIIDKYLDYSRLKTQLDMITACLVIIDDVLDRNAISRDILSMGFLKNCRDSSKNLPDVNQFLSKVENDYVSIVEDNLNMFRSPA